MTAPAKHGSEQRRRQRMVSVRLTEQEYHAIALIADRCNQTPAAYMRERVLKGLRRFKIPT